MTDFAEGGMPEASDVLPKNDPSKISTEDEARIFDEMFAVDHERDITDVRAVLRGIRKQPTSSGVFVDQWSYESARNRGELKYSDDQIKGDQWDERDFVLAVEELKRIKIEKFYSTISHQYEQVSPIPDSIVRLDQERAIGDDLDAGTPVLIRGNWRMGKTSMVRSLTTHKFGEAREMYINAAIQGLSSEEFAGQFGLYDVAGFIAEREVGNDADRRRSERDNIVAQMKSSGTAPFEYLDSYLEGKGEEVFLGIDEVMGYADDDSILSYFSNLKNLKNIRTAIVLHRMAKHEDKFKNVFSEFKTHFVRALRRDEVESLVTKPLKGTPIVFTADAIDEIINFTGGRPMEINNLCMGLFSTHSEYNNQKVVYRAEDIRRIISSDIYELSSVFSAAIDTYTRIYEKSMSDPERDFINQLTASGGVPIPGVSEELVQPLIDTTYVKRDEQRGVYVLNGGLFEKVVQKIMVGA